MTLHWVELAKDTSIYEQLLLEEQLLKNDTRNFCLVNHGTAPAIVMGISGKPEELIHQESARALQLPLIKRFSGGGTVVVDENTLFVTFIFQKDAHPFTAYPEPIMRWSEEIYKPLFGKSAFALRENDYVLGERKFGGNAQYIRKERWLHHTSFLWDYDPTKMSSLLLPKKRPSYRGERNHEEFLCTMKELFPTPGEFFMELKKSLAEHFVIEEVDLETIALQEMASYSTKLIEKPS